MSQRQTTFDRLVEDYDERQLPRVLDFHEHRFVSVERDSVSGATFIQGHKTIRGACGHLSRSVQGCERFIPERVVDLDTGEQHELDVFAFVAPKHVDAVAVMLPRHVADFVLGAVNNVDRSDVETGRLWKAAAVALERVLDRRS